MIREVIKIFLHELSFFEKMIWHFVNAEEEYYLKAFEGIRSGKLFDEIRAVEFDEIKADRADGEEIILNCEDEKLEFETGDNEAEDLLKEIEQ